MKKALMGSSKNNDCFYFLAKVEGYDERTNNNAMCLAHFPFTAINWLISLLPSSFHPKISTFLPFLLYRFLPIKSFWLLV